MSARISPRLCHVVQVTLAFSIILGVLAAPREASLGLAQAADRPKIAPVLLAQMQAHPLQRLPVIVEMKPPKTPSAAALSFDRSQQALAILQAHGQAFGSLAIIGGAAGYANAA